MRDGAIVQTFPAPPGGQRLFEPGGSVSEFAIPSGHTSLDVTRGPYGVWFTVMNVGEVDRAATETPPPTLGETFNSKTVAGVVSCRPPRGRFARVTRTAQFRVGAECDTTRGRIVITTASRRGKTTNVQVFGGRFIVRQRKSANPVTELTLSGPLHRMERHISVSGRGKDRTHGKYATAAATGTVWETRDVGGATVVRVRSGSVDVYDRVKRRHVIVRRGQSYVAKPGPK